MKRDRPGSRPDGVEAATFAQTVETGAALLTEAAILERLRRELRTPLDPEVANAACLYDPAARAAMAAIHRQYLEVGRAWDLPLLLLTPTWRASAERLTRAGLSHRDVNGDAVRYLRDLRETAGGYASKVFLGGLLGPRGDGYRPEEAPGPEQAAALHRPQVRALAAGGVDCLVAATLPAAPEALGLARVLGETGVPYLLSFVVRPTGALLDGTPLRRAVETIDAAAEPAPLGYLINCVHPTVFEAALDAAIAADPAVAPRILGLQGNTSTRPPEELDGSPELRGEDPAAFADAMARLRERFGATILGGCCGTDDRHLRELARRLAGDVPTSGAGPEG